MNIAIKYIYKIHINKALKLFKDLEVWYLILKLGMKGCKARYY